MIDVRAYCGHDDDYPRRLLADMLFSTGRKTRQCMEPIMFIHYMPQICTSKTRRRMISPRFASVTVVDTTAPHALAIDSKAWFISDVRREHSQTIASDVFSNADLRTERDFGCGDDRPISPVSSQPGALLRDKVHLLWDWAM